MMKTLFAFLTLMACSTLTFAADCSDLLNINKQRLASEEVVNLCDTYQGKVILIVNTASKCGYTYQYDGLETLYQRYEKQGFVVLGFPSNDFANQEPGNEQHIQEFCRLTYGVKFPMFAKTHVAQGTSDPLFIGLAKASGTYPQWNFHKYLLDRNGKVVDTYSSRLEPLSKKMVKDIESLL